MEEVSGKGDEILHRETVMYFDNETGAWVRPDDRLTEEQQKVWTALMEKIIDIQGQDVRHMIHPVSLMDFCHTRSPEGAKAWELGRAEAVEEKISFKTCRIKAATLSESPLVEQPAEEPKEEPPAEEPKEEPPAEEPPAEEPKEEPPAEEPPAEEPPAEEPPAEEPPAEDRKSTRLNSSHRV